MFLAEDPHPHLGLWMGADLYLFTLHLDLKDGQCPEGSPGPGESGQSSSHQTFHYELGIAGAKQCHDRLIPDLFKKKKKCCSEVRKAERTHSGAVLDIEKEGLEKR